MIQQADKTARLICTLPSITIFIRNIRVKTGSQLQGFLFCFVLFCCFVWTKIFLATACALEQNKPTAIDPLAHRKFRKRRDIKANHDDFLVKANQTDFLALWSLPGCPLLPNYGNEDMPSCEGVLRQFPCGSNTLCQ